MNNTKKSTLKSLLKLLGSVLLFDIVIFYIMDDLFNGIIADWIEKKFIWSDEAYAPRDINGNTVWIRWPQLKYQLICCFLLLTIAIVIAIWLLCRYYARRKNRELMECLAAQMDTYLENTGQDLSIFSDEFTAVCFQLSKLRNKTMKKEKQLEQEMQQKNDLITFLAHDLKIPLASVIGYLCLLEENPSLPAALREQYTGITLEKAYRLEQLINEFFEITRYNLHTIIINPSRIHLKPMLLQLADEFYPILESEHKQIEVDAPENLYLTGDADKLARVFNNILKNAAAYSYENTTIFVKARTVGHYIVLTFTNEGIPIPEHQRDTIFEKFYRLDNARSSKTGGSGLGLAIAKEIVEAHRGKISVESDISATVFTVMLPMREERSEKNAAPDHTPD